MYSDSALCLCVSILIIFFFNKLFKDVFETCYCTVHMRNGGEGEEEREEMWTI